MNEIIIDTCCFINLYATECISDLLRSLDWSWYLPRSVMNEALYIRTKDDQGEVARTPIDTQTLLSTDLIRAVDLEDAEELDLYVRLATELDDGEAMALAIAEHRGWKLATDDRKARRFADDLGIGLVTTTEIMRKWACVSSPNPSQLAKILRNIEFAARFTPADYMPEYEWWVNSLKSS